MRIIFFLTMLCISLTMWGRDKYYNNKAEQEALKKAFEIVKVYYPANTVCASDSIFDHDWMFAAGRLDKEIKDELFQIRIDKKYRFDAPIYSKNMARVLKADNCDCSDYKYEAEFSAPYKGMIMCEIMPRNRLVGMAGEPRISTFLFRFDED